MTIKTVSFDKFERIAEKSDSYDKFWNEKKFKIVCAKCGSTNIQTSFRDKVIDCGSTQTGCWTSDEGKILIKCKHCGLAMIMEFEGT